MLNSRELIEIVDRFGAHNYKPLPVVLNKGAGAWVWDVEGRKYLDFLSGYSAVNFGHSHPRIVRKLQEQVAVLSVSSRAFHSEELCLFSRELAEFCGMEAVLPMNSGAEAVESAIKLARKWGYQTKKVAPEQANLIVMKNNFHGRTVTLVSFSTEPMYRADFGPFTPGFKLVEFGDLGEVEKAIDENTVAVLLEPIQAEAGILIPKQGYLSNLRKICSKNKILLMFDEIQTGLGRTGRNFCFQHEDAKPDVLILGKSLGGGVLPLSAIVSSRKIMDVIHPGEHGSTFGGNPLACSVGREALKVINEEELAKKSDQIGKRTISELRSASLPKVREIRGQGALIGIELTSDAGGARRYCEVLADEGVLCKETHEVVIRIAPPLVISDGDLTIGIKKIIDVVRRLGS